MKFLATCALLLGLGLSLAATAQTFNDFLTRVNIAPEAHRPAIVDSFMAACPSFPYVEQDTLCHFIYRGTANRVTVPGDANSWDPDAWGMSRPSGTDFWYYSCFFESDARLDYKFVINGSNWILDPRNPYTCTGGFGPNSELRMPGYVMPPEIAFYSDIPHGALHDTLFYSQQLGNTRRIRVYTPPGYDASSDHYGVMLFHDGLEYVSLADADNVLDYLIAHGRIQPIIGVFVPPVNRTEEYASSLQNQFVAFIVEDVMPWVDSRYRTLSDPAHRGTLGASYGGNISLVLASSHPEVFGLCAPQSAYVQPSLFTTFQSGPTLDLKLCLGIGTYDIPELIPLVRNLRDILQQRGYTYRYDEYHEGHSWGNWRAHVDVALEFLFPGDSLAPAMERPTVPDDFFMDVFPNPFNSRTTITFTLPRPMTVKLVLYDIAGRQTRALADQVFDSGVHRVSVDSSDLASGVYFAQLCAANTTITRKLVLVK